MEPSFKYNRNALVCQLNLEQARYQERHYPFPHDPPLSHQELP